MGGEAYDNIGRVRKWWEAYGAMSRHRE